MKKRASLLLGITIIFTTGCSQFMNITKVCNSGRGKAWTSVFNVNKEDFTDTGRNSGFILEPGYTLTLQGKENGGNVKLIIKVLNKIQRIDGVMTRVVEERETHDGQLVEVSRNFFAIDKKTNVVFYFGEDVDIYKQGRVINHEGSWRSGTDGARFGLMLPESPLAGARYYQEKAKGVALDRAEIVSLTETLEVPAGKFDHCVKTEETTPLEPGVKEYKYYAPGAGIVMDGALKLVKYGFEENL